jgi:succinate dehydrogenase/fumarate reductase-like Fe-S protein
MQQKEEMTTIKVFRFDPSDGSKARFDSYEVPYTGYTVLGTLEYVYKHYDSSLAFRAGCLGKGSGRCGACPVMVNGIPALSCQKMAEADMTVEPHPKFEIIKDVVVDLSSVRPEAPRPKATFKITIDEDKCVGCRDCSYICPAQVYEMKKIGKKRMPDPVDANYCCGITCKMCSMHCSHDAITVEQLP